MRRVKEQRGERLEFQVFVGGGLVVFKFITSDLSRRRSVCDDEF